MEEIFENIKNTTNDFIKDAKKFIKEQKNKKLWYCDTDMWRVYQVLVIEEDDKYYKTESTDKNCMFEWVMIPKKNMGKTLFKTKKEAVMAFKKIKNEE